MTPTITVVTPSFNQGEFLEQTIRSVLEQDYANVEYLVIDGGSTDGSVDIIRKYADSLAYWVSEPDRGQCHAINKGYARATGDIFCWLNSDDYFEAGALGFAGRYFQEHPECQWLVGRCRIVSEDGTHEGMYEPRYGGRESLLRFWDGDNTMLPQPSSFWRRDLVEGKLLREDLHCVLDHELWLRLCRETSPVLVPEVLANYRLHQGAKTVAITDTFLAEHLRVCRPEWRQRGVSHFLSCERGWRRQRSVRLFQKAFDLRQEGAFSEARGLLMNAIACYPLCLGQWRVVNLMARLVCGSR